MRFALRRVIWIVPTLVAVTALAFAVLASMQSPRAQERDAPAALPLFFNSKPRDARERALDAVDRVARGGAQSEPAARELVRIGGAALPYVLPRLDAFAPDARARVALAIAPIARRMNIGATEELDDPQAAVLFWARFWQDRGVDYRPLVVKRLVRRVAEQSSGLRRSDVLELDTYALADLVENMKAVKSAGDVARARRLSELAAHVTGLDLVILPDASLDEARKVVEAWQRWWLDHRAEYTTFDGPRRITAMITETRYGRWAQEAASRRFGLTREGAPVLDLVKERAPVTAWLVTTALLAGYLLGIAWGLLIPEAGRLGLASSALAVAVVALPVAAAAAWLAPGAASERFLPALLMAGSAAALVSRYQRASARTALGQDYVRTARAFGAGAVRLRLRAFPAASASVISLIAVDLPAVFSSAVVVEHAFGLPGIGRATLEAVAERDVPWLMAMTLGIALVIALAQIASDALLGALDPRVKLAFLRQRGASE